MRRFAYRVKLPKTFLAVNLSYAFTFQEKQHQADNEGLEMKAAELGNGNGHGHETSGEPVAAAAESTDAETPVTTTATATATGDTADEITETDNKSVITTGLLAPTETDKSEITTAGLLARTTGSEEPPQSEPATETAAAMTASEDQAKPEEGQGGDAEVEVEHVKGG